MADGTRRAISDVEVGDYVLAEDPETGERGPRRVTHVWEHEDAVVDLEIDGDLVTTTEDHPFWNATDAEWQEAQDLDPGDLVRSAEGELVQVGGVRLRTARTTSAFNLTVDGIHTYFIGVGEDDILVHNTCGGHLPTQVAGRTQRLTTSQATDLAEYLGYRPTNQIVQGERVFTNGKTFIVQDATSHIGGTWKIAGSVRDLASKTTRTATTDALLHPIGG
jgi:hypothetical protein